MTPASNPPFKNPSNGHQSIPKKVDEINPEQYQCAVANDDYFQLLSANFCLRAMKVNVQKEGANGLEVL